MDQLDPVAAIAEAARRLTVESKTAEQISRAKVRIATGRATRATPRTPVERAEENGKSAFFAEGIFRTNHAPDWNTPTACTNGKETKYGPDYVAGLDVFGTVGLLAHEGWHDLFGHHAEIASILAAHPNADRQKILTLCNVAADLAANYPLRQCGIELPKDALQPGDGEYKDHPHGLHLRDYFARLYADQQPDPSGSDSATGQGTPGDGTPQPGNDPGSPGNGPPQPGPESFGWIEPGPELESAGARARSAADAKERLQSAYQSAQKHGTLPGQLDRLLAGLLKPKTDVADALADFLTCRAKIDHSWQRPNRKYLAQGLYLPSLSGEILGHVVILNDTSGSITDDIQQSFRSRIEGLLCLSPVRVTIIHHDSEVSSVETWEPSDGPLPWHATGGGGTDHRPAFAHCETLETPPDLIVALSDLCSVFPATAPDCPVLFATTEDRPHPFGQKLMIEV